MGSSPPRRNNSSSGRRLGNARMWVIPENDPVSGLLLPTLRSQKHIVRTVGYFSSGLSV